MKVKVSARCFFFFVFYIIIYLFFNEVLYDSGETTHLLSLPCWCLFYYLVVIPLVAFPCDGIVLGDVAESVLLVIEKK